MPMDIRNFFGKAAPKKASSDKNNNQDNNKKSSNSSSATASRAAISRKPQQRQPAATTKKATTAKVNNSKSSSSAATAKEDAKSNAKKLYNNNKPSISDKSKDRPVISVDTDDDDQQRQQQQQQKRKTPTLAATTKKKSNRVIIDDSDDDHVDDGDVVEKSKTNTTAKASPATKKATKASVAVDNKQKSPMKSVNDGTSLRRTTAAATSTTMASTQDSLVEVSVDEYFRKTSQRSSKDSLQEGRQSHIGHQRKPISASHSKVKQNDVNDKNDNDEDFVVDSDNEGDDDEDDDNFDDDDEDNDDEGHNNKRRKTRSNQIVTKVGARASKRKMDDNFADNEEEIASPRKSPRKASSVSPKSKQTTSLRQQPKQKQQAPPRSSPRKMPRTTSSPPTTTTLSKAKSMPATTTVSALPHLEPGLQVDSFDIDAVDVPECLAGTTFVFSGIIDSLSRDDAQEMVKTLGGRVTGNVSNKTTYLVLGNILEDGRAVTEGKKYQLAKERKVKLVHGEKELYGLLKLYHDRAAGQQQQQKTVPPTTMSARETQKQRANIVATSDSNVNQLNLKPPPTTIPVANVYAKKPPATLVVSNPYAKKITNPYASSQRPKSTESMASSQLSSSGFASHNLPSSNRLWADKYAPQVSQEVLGNKESVDKLSKWLQRWEITFDGRTKVKTSDSGPKKAALLSGPPGIGKTTTANLVAKEAGRDILEFNASDVRSKKALQNDLGDVTGSQSINFASTKSGKAQISTRKRVLIMDEVDGMGAGDRNGMAELIKMIKASHVPIICICNDRQSQKIRSLVPYCLDLRFRRPTKSVIANRAMKVASMEGLQVERNAAEAIAESCGNDVRQVLNCLQMWASQGHQGDRMTYKDLKERENFINKDDILRVNIFDATKLIVEGRKGLNDADQRTQVDSFYRRNDAFFVDYSLMGLNVHQNYMKVMIAPYSDVKRTDDPDKMVDFLNRMHEAAHAMSDFALVEREVRGGDMNWSLLPFAGLLTVKTGFHAGGETGSFFPGFPDFPAWMGKNSTRGKKSRILQDLSYHMNYKVSGGRSELRLSYVPTLRERLYSMIANGDESDTTRAIHLMDEYGLDRDDVFERLDEFKIDSKVDFSKIEGKAKAAFTREYNSLSHKSQALVAEQGGGASKRKRGQPAAISSSGEKDPADLDAIDEDGPLADADDDQSDDNAEEEDYEKIKKIFGKTTRGGGKKKNTRPSAAASTKTTKGKRKR